MFSQLFPNAAITTWAEPTDDGLLFAAYAPNGVYVQADSPAALAAALLDAAEQSPAWTLRLAA